MITKRISTETILANLKNKVDNRLPIMISSAGSGLVAKLQEAAGTDCINTFSGARLRANGMGTIKYTGLDNDRDPVLFAIGGSIPTNIVNGYLREDLNLDGQVKYMGPENDRDLILLNIGGSIPTASISEQLP